MMKKFSLMCVVLAGVTIWSAVFILPDDNLHVIFCDVGQGDATLVTYRSHQLLVDTGADNRVLECLNKYIPFYDRKLEAVIVTHDQSDHRGGSRYIAERYTVVQFEPVLRKGNVLVVGDIKLKVLSPDSKVLGLNTLGKENDEGIVGTISWRKFKLLLTADATSDIYPIESGVTVLKVPHHGSKFAMTKEWLKSTRPGLAVISVGKNNYGHPAPEILEMLEDLTIDMARTDVDGDVEIVTDGEKWWRRR